MNIRESIEIIEGRNPRVKVRGRELFIDGNAVGEIRGGRFRHRGVITPNSGYYLRLPDGRTLFRRDGSGEFAYAEDLIKNVGYNPDEILAKVAAE
jgi:hypothetical protein